MQRIHARLFQPFGNLHGFLERVAAGFGGHHGIGMVGPAELGLQVELAAGFGADRGDNLEQEPGAVLERAAVAIGTVVDGGGQELVDQVAVGGVSSTPSSPASRALRAPSAKAATVAAMSSAVILWA